MRSAAGHEVRLGPTRWRRSGDFDAGLDRIVEHNAGDLTAVVDARACGWRELQARRAGEAGQMLALDPPRRRRATLGGVVATADSGPLRHRYGSARDLVVGITVALADGTVAKSGGKVIKNVAGYDLAKLFTGSFGTLGAILEVSVRLHPLAAGDRDRGRAQRTIPRALAAAAGRLSHAPLELQCLDVRWERRRTARCWRAWAGGRGRGGRPWRAVADGRPGRGRSRTTTRDGRRQRERQRSRPRRGGAGVRRPDPADRVLRRGPPGRARGRPRRARPVVGRS